jgi:hypothetical protein
MRVAVAHRLPVEYDREAVGSLLAEIERQLNLLSEGRLAGRHFTATSVPTTGSFARGDIIWNATPSAAGTVGWVCVAAGSPGTLKAFGTIAA